MRNSIFKIIPSELIVIIFEYLCIDIQTWRQLTLNKDLQKYITDIWARVHVRSGANFSRVLNSRELSRCRNIKYNGGIIDYTLLCSLDIKPVYLDVSDNEFNCHLHYPESVRHLVAANCGLIGIAKGREPRLRTLNCNGNKIVRISSKITTRIRELYCSNNQIMKLKKLPCATKIDCSHNPMHEFNCSSTDLKCLVVHRGQFETVRLATDNCSIIYDEQPPKILSCSGASGHINPSRGRRYYLRNANI